MWGFIATLIISLVIGLAVIGGLELAAFIAVRIWKRRGEDDGDDHLHHS